MIKLGITGGIGSGKSFVSRLLAGRGVPVFDCDSQAKCLTVVDAGIRSELIALLGPEVYIGEKINKLVLADYLFASEENAKRINAIIHPRVRSAFREWTMKHEEEGVQLVVMESAILFESGFHTEVDRVLMIHAPLDVRCQRVIERDHATIDQVRKRIASQDSDEVKCSRADYILENDGIKPLQGQLDKLFLQLQTIKANK